jgi:DNA-binding transcriptional LysR family regulator
VLAALARADAAVERLRTTPRGRVRMAIFPSGARMLLAGVLARLDDVPGLDLQARDVDMTPSDVPVLAAEFDVVVTHRDERSPAPSTERWQVVPLLREPLDVALPPGHPLARRRTLRLDELAGEAWISVDVGWPVDDVLRSLSVGNGAAPRVVQRINDFSVTEELVAAGRGIALLPRYSTDDHGGRRLARRPLAGVRAARLVEVVLRTSTAERPAVRTLLDVLRAEADALVAARG